MVDMELVERGSPKKTNLKKEKRVFCGASVVLLFVFLFLFLFLICFVLC